MITSLYDCFRHWSKNGSVYIISDLHFDDVDCKIMDSKWISSEEHITLLKKYVHKTDTLIILGDIGNPEYLKQLKGYKVLISGNHDRGLEYYKPYFDELYDGPLVITPKIILSHEPLPTMSFWLNIHGHDHSGKKYKDSYHINVASNVIDYKPISLGELIKSGRLSKIDDIHRLTIDKATENPIHKRSR